MKTKEKKSVVVTGTGKGMGRAIAAHLSSQGWFVVGVERSSGSNTISEGVCHEVIIGDSSEKPTHRLAAQAAVAEAPLIGWVNNAGITRRTPLHELDEEAVREIVSINGFGYLWGCAAAVEAFMEQDVPGAIVNIGSIHGRISFPGFAAYDFTKGGIDALARSVAVSYGALGIRANTLAPGAVWTPHLETFIAEAPDPKLLESALLGGSPSGRFATMDEVARVTAFLLSPESSYLNGQSIALDGGWTASSGVGELDDSVKEKLSDRAAKEG
jgi:NAD(P)-dependent dehydrogenase (short-subunit alcohol dehydrogenase family)